MVEVRTGNRKFIWSGLRDKIFLSMVVWTLWKPFKKLTNAPINVLSHYSPPSGIWQTNVKFLIMLCQLALVAQVFDIVEGKKSKAPYKMEQQFHINAPTCNTFWLMHHNLMGIDGEYSYKRVGQWKVNIERDRKHNHRRSQARSKAASTPSLGLVNHF